MVSVRLSRRAIRSGSEAFRRHGCQGMHAAMRHGSELRPTRSATPLPWPTRSLKVPQRVRVLVPSSDLNPKP